MKIAVGNSRMDKKWKNREISWEDLCQKVNIRSFPEIASSFFALHIQIRQLLS